MKDLVLGLAANYDWAAIQPFIVSLIRSGFSGDVALFVKNLTPDATTNLKNLGVLLIDIPNIEFSDPQTPCGRYFPYVGRFLLIHKFLEEHAGEYRFVICSDIRDVVFQSNPIEWLDNHISRRPEKLIVAPEYILHQDQPGNAKWVSQGFKEVSSWILPKMVYCSGLVAGYAPYISDVALAVYLSGRQLSATIWGSDQPVYNTVMHQRAYSDISYVPELNEQWAINLVVMSLTKERSLMLDAPSVRPFGVGDEGLTRDIQLLWNFGIPNLDDFTILHQYDRIPPLADVVRREYSIANINRHPIRFKTTQF